MRRAGVARHVTTSRRPDVILTSLSSRYSRRRHGDVTSLTTTSWDSHKTLPVTSCQRHIVVIGYQTTPLPRRHRIPDDVTFDVSIMATLRRHDVVEFPRYSRRRHGDVTSLTTTPHDVGVVTSSSRLTSRDSHKTLPVTSRQRRIVVVGYRSTPLPRRHGIPDDVTSDVSVAATLRRHCNVASVTRNN